MRPTYQKTEVRGQKTE